MVTVTETRDTDTRDVVVTDGRNRTEDVVWFILAIVGAILLVRFIMLLFGARQGVPFVEFWYGISAPLVAPFAGIFGNDTYNTYSGSRFEAESLVAMLVYALIAYLIVLGIRLLSPNARKDAV